MESDLYRKCPAGCALGVASRPTDDPNVTAWGDLCETCNGWGFVPVVAPAPTDTLRAAAQAVKRAFHDDYEFNLSDDQMTALSALRAALDAPPVALTGEDRAAITEVVIAETVGEIERRQDVYACYERVTDAVLAKLNDLGYTIVRRTA